MRSAQGVLAISVILTVLGCSTPGAMGEIVKSWEGAPVVEAVRQIGPPAAQGRFGQSDFYTWRLWSGESYTVTRQSIVGGATGCELTFETDPSGKIKGGSWRGSPCCNTTAGVGRCNALLRKVQ